MKKMNAMHKAVMKCAAGGQIEEAGEDPAEEASESPSQEAAEEAEEEHSKGQVIFPAKGKKKKKKKHHKKGFSMNSTKGMASGGR